jgi:uncharacterized membrane protein
MRTKTQLGLMLTITALMLLSIVPTATATPASAYSLVVKVQMSPTGTTPVGIGVQISNLATGQSCTGKTVAGGTFLFTSALNCPALSAGWWKATVPPQQLTISPGNVWFVTPPNSTGVNVAVGQPTGTAVAAVISGVNMTADTSTITGNVKNVVPGATYHVQLLDPKFPGYVMSSANTTAPLMVKAPTTDKVSSMVALAPAASTLTLTFVLASPCKVNFNGVDYVNGQSAPNLVSGTTFPINADACPGWSFNTWSTNAGSLASPTSSSTTITVTNNGSLVANYTTQTASFTLNNVPMGTWTLYTFGITTASAGYNYYNFTSVDVSKKTVWQNVSLQSYLIFGNINTPSGTLGNATNVTLWDSSSHEVFPTYVPPTGSTYYQAGAYSADVGASSGSQSFVAFVAPQGYSSAFYNMTISATSPVVEFDPVVSLSTPSTYHTNISFTNFSNVNVNSMVSLRAGSTLSQLPNASVGNLWAQIGLDFNNSMPGVNAHAFGLFQKWLLSSGPVYPAQSEGLAVNATGFQDNGSYALSYGTYSFPGNAYYYSTAGMSYATSRSYTLSPGVTAKSSSYRLSVGFNYPTSTQNLSYTVNLPYGYVLLNGTAAPNGTSLTPSGPVGPGGNLWTSFTISPHSYNNLAHGIGNFTIYKVTNVTAVVNMTSSDFAFSSRNVFNATNGNYTVLVGVGNNVTLTASHSLVPATMNVTNYEWNFSSSPATNCLTKGQTGYLTAMCVNTNNTNINHYFDTGGVVHGSLTLLASGGKSNSTKFTVYVDDNPPSPMITVNNTHVASINAATKYLYVNWSTLLQFNATGSTDTIDNSLSGGHNNGTISVSDWNFTSGPTYHNTNYSLSRGSKVMNNVTYQFLGAGTYEKNNVSIAGQKLRLNGWLYNITLTQWDAGGNKAMTNMYVLVNDTEKPVAVGSVQNSAGKNVTGGLVENKNGTVQIGLLENYSYDPHNGTIASYSWNVNNPAGENVSGHFINSTKTTYWNSSTPIKWALYLAPSTGTYNFTLNITDLAGNYQKTTYPVTVAQNLTFRPVITVSNLTAPTTWTDGSGVTIWCNVNNTGFSTSVAYNVNVSFYLTAPSGTAQTSIGGSPSNVRWYGYVKGILNSSASYTGVLPAMKANQTWMAQITYTPSQTGTYWLWANGTASNEFPGEYKSGVNVAHMSVTINASSLTLYIEIAVIVVVVAVVIVLAIFLWRRKNAVPVSKKEKDKKAQEKKEKAAKEEEEEEDTKKADKEEKKEKD